MALFQITITKDHDWASLNQLCALDFLHFQELNGHLQPHNLPYADKLRRCEDSLKRVGIIEDIYTKFAVPMLAPESHCHFEECAAKLQKQEKCAQHQLYSHFEDEIIAQTNFMRQQVSLIDETTRDFRQVLFRINIYDAVAKMFHAPASQSDLERSRREEIQEPLISQDILETTRIVYYGGVIARTEEQGLKRLLFRSTRGKAILQTFELEVDPQDQLRGEDFQTRLIGYLIMFEGGPMQKIVERVCQGFNFGGERANFEVAPSHVQEGLKEAIAAKNQLRELVTKSKATFYDYLGQYKDETGISLIKIYKAHIMRERAIAKTLNMFKSVGSLLVGLVWIPEERTQELLRFEVRTESGMLVEMQIQSRKPDAELDVPTFNKANDFADINQVMVDTYGVPAYKEANPAVFTTVTFPFLFAIMFGDILHGAMLLAIALLVLMAGEKNCGPALWQCRWMLLLMGMFSSYTGFIYNDFTSVPIYAFPSCYTYHEGDPTPTVAPNCVYPAGVDPSWYLATSELTYMNSMKMKISVIFGVCQMSLGIFLKGSNNLYQRKWLDFVFEFVPQILMLLALFGYMDYLIIDKWLTDWGDQTMHAPSIIAMMIDMALNGGMPSTPGDLPIVGGSLETQKQVENILMYIVLLCVPLMLCVKPCYAMCTAKPESEGDDEFVRADSVAQGEDDQFDLHTNIVKSLGKEHGHSENFKEIFIHQMIETIEFVLGTVSNTASYLRLWALSLAHGQLAKVFFDMCLVDGLQSGDFLTLYISFFVFMGASVGVLMCMDLLECCLHTLRLHWVEFQSKFFHGGGVAFEPTVMAKVTQQTSDK